MMTEEWRHVLGYGGLYEVSNYGSVRSFRHRRSVRKTPKTLCPSRGRNGYMVVNLCHRRVTKLLYVHALVLEAFRGPRPAGCESSHIDGTRTNNCIDNLVWETRKENTARALVHGTIARGERIGVAKLTPALVRLARQRAALGEFHSDIAVDMGVSGQTIGCLVSRKTWAHVL